MEGKAFLEIAQRLSSMRMEAASRSAVSRGYYAAYNCCIQFLRELGFRFEKNASSHEKVYQYLHNSGIAEIKSSVRMLRDLRQHRNEADYDMSSTKFQNHITCQWDIVHAQGIIAQIEKYHNEPHRAQLVTGLRDVHAKIHP